MKRPGWTSAAAYVALLAAALAVAVTGSWVFGRQIDNFVYDEMFRMYRPPAWQPHSVLLAIDERTLNECGGMPNIRGPLTRGLRLIASARPAAVAVDIILADRREKTVDEELAAAFRATPNLVLSSELLKDGWEDPLPEFRAAAAAVGHVHALPDEEARIFDGRVIQRTSASDAVTRSIHLEKHFGQKRLWALSLEAFRLSRGAPIIENTTDLAVGKTVIPASYPGRLMRVRFLPPDRGIPRITLAQLLHEPALAARFGGKAAFVGVTAQTEHDRLFSPYSNGDPTSGIEINAEAFETMAQGVFITDVDDLWVVLFSMLLVACAGLAFRYLPVWAGYFSGVAIIAAASIAPYVFFTHRLVFSFITPASAAWFGVLTSIAYYHLVVRRSLRRSEAERTRYQQAMHFVTHEMRTPLSAIQGSSELISRFAMTEEKRKQIALLINSESKRLARMVEIFLNVERLSAGQMELKREAIAVKEMVEICVARVEPLAQRKHIGIKLEPVSEDLQVTGDRELMEYACYNLLTNAVKYSPQHTEVTVWARKDGGDVRIAVQDQGIGMDQKEVKQIFRKFYRTKKAEESGEAGTGIGLSIVQQIVEQHGGEIEVISQPGVGSCFTLVLPAAAAAAAERH